MKIDSIRRGLGVTKITVWSLMIAALVFVGGCSSSTAAKSSTLKSFDDVRFIVKTVFARIPVYNSTIVGRRKVTQEVESAPAKVQRLSVMIRFFYADIPDHFIRPREVAHYHPDRREICLVGAKYNEDRCSGTLRHELAHDFIRFYKVSLEPWKKIAGAVYHDLADTVAYPRDGLLTSYSRTSAEEDVAEWVYAIYQLVYAMEPKHFRGIDKKDERYLKKLQWLFDQELITKKEYERVKKELT